MRAVPRIASVDLVSADVGRDGLTVELFQLAELLPDVPPHLSGACEIARVLNHVALKPVASAAQEGLVQLSHHELALGFELATHGIP